MHLSPSSAPNVSFVCSQPRRANSRLEDFFRRHAPSHLCGSQRRFPFCLCALLLSKGNGWMRLATSPNSASARFRLSTTQTPLLIWRKLSRLDSSRPQQAFEKTKMTRTRRDGSSEGQLCDSSRMEPSRHVVSRVLCCLRTTHLADNLGFLFSDFGAFNSMSRDVQLADRQTRSPTAACLNDPSTDRWHLPLRNSSPEGNE